MQSAAPMPQLLRAVRLFQVHLMTFFPLSVVQVRPLAEDAVGVRLAVPDGQRDTFSFLPGQYVTLRHTVAGEELRRSYSISSEQCDQSFEIGVRKVQGGRISTFLHDELQIGDVLEAAPPEGAFTLPSNTSGRKDYLCIAAGSGITPVLAMLRWILANEPDSTVTLLYGNRRVASIMFREELDGLKNRYMDRFQLIHVLSQEKRDTDLLNGRIDNRKGAELCRHLLNLEQIDEFLLCGPEGMIAEVSRGLRANGIPESRIRYELFGASAADAESAVARHKERVRRFGGKVCRVVVKADGRETQLDLAPDGENILDAAMAAGVDLPYACKGGACATCKARVVSGEVEMDVAHALTADEIAQGFVLSCQSHPVSSEVYIDFDRAV